MKLRANNRRGFTLLEVLVVVALTVLIIGLVFGPVVQSFNFTRRAEVMVRVQDNSRLALQQISRDLADAMYVFDNTRDPINFPVPNAAGTQTILVPVYYAKVDLVLPRMRGYCTSPNHPAGKSREYPRHYRDGTGKEDPALDEAAPVCPEDGSLLELRPVQPLAPDTKIVRYFIALRDPAKPYANGYTHKFSTASADNMFVLYRAEFSLDDARLFDQSKARDDNFTDPNFFYNSAYYAAWQQISRPLVTLEDTDLVNIDFDPDTGAPIVTPTVKFMPTAIYNDPLTPTTEADDDPEHGDSPPTVYKATYGQWVYPYEITVVRRTNGGAGTVVYKALPSTNNEMCVYREDSGPNYTLVFNITQYERTRSDPGYPGSVYGVGDIQPANPDLAFTVNARRGTVHFAFPVVDIPLSEQSGPELKGKTGVSVTETTAKINGDYLAAQAGNFEDVYRQLIVNMPNRCPLANGTVVAGTERVLAPDVQPGTRFAQYIRYSRVPFLRQEPGLNQYALIPDYTVLGGAGNPVPGAAAVRFHSVPTQEGAVGIPLPELPDRKVFVYYEVQNNQRNDSLRANYVTKSLMTVILGIKVYESNTGRPQSVQLTNKIRLRNIAS